MLQTPLKRAFGSISSDWVNTSPLMLAVAFSISFSVIRIEPSTSPKISALVEIMLPTTRPFGPTTIFPLQLMSPSTCPSNLKSVSVIILPFTFVPAARVLCRPPAEFSSF